MKTTVYLIRHAEAEGNVYRRCHGQYDSLLTPRAWQQLPYLGRRFASVPLDRVYASDLFRARATAKAVAEPHGLPVELRPVLREIDMGDWEDLTWAELPRWYPVLFAQWKTRPWEARPPHGENVMEAGSRMLNGVRELVRENEGKTIAVVTHGSAIRGALALARQYAPEQVAAIGWGDNTCVSQLVFDGADDPAIDVVYQNDASHLPEALSTFAAIGWKDNTSLPASAELWFRRADPLDASDAEKIVAWMREQYRCQYGTDRRLDPDQLLRDVAAAQRVSPRSVTFGCYEDTPLALVYLKTGCQTEQNGGAVGLVGGFWIDPDWRGRGFSGQLLGQAISVYRQLGCDSLCFPVTEINERAQAFCHRFSFALCGTIQDENGIHCNRIKQISIPHAGL